MFYHIKDLQFNARVSKADPRFARLLLEQFGGPNGELKAAMQYFVQAFAARQPFPKEYDLLMDIATEEFSHLEIVGATIQMLLNGVNGELKDVADKSEIMQLLDGKDAKENMIHQSMTNPQFLNNSGGSPTLTDSNGNPWTAAYVTANGDLTVDLRSNIAAESRAKIVYEYLMQFTDDAYVKETLQFLMTREIAHFQMFEAALENIQPNFPPGIQQGDPRYSNKYFNMSNGSSAKGPWNEGVSTGLGETWEYIDDPVEHVLKTNGLLDEPVSGTQRTMESAKEKTEDLSKVRTQHIKGAVPKGENQWSRYEKGKIKQEV
ncbi:Mn-containing catalase [Fulvivirga imtechensis AK7]|uniref:Mn-containing catalase n=1 Tax=Fulvivirga imtechensis AK7 TaxID=1237149 RepID=L8JVL8_9BACT|nr:manganese catalase family protein [Fulvivirga imtechensis]ELR71659.1 Mn-containing catalase [Fulvivirga imtechensis AK7]